MLKIWHIPFALRVALRKCQVAGYLAHYVLWGAHMPASSSLPVSFLPLSRFPAHGAFLLFIRNTQQEEKKEKGFKDLALLRKVLCEVQHPQHATENRGLLLAFGDLVAPPELLAHLQVRLEARFRPDVHASQGT